MITNITPQQRADLLHEALAEATARIDELQRRYEADCTSCADQHTGRCGVCSMRAKLRYRPIGINDDGILIDEIG